MPTTTLTRDASNRTRTGRRSLGKAPDGPPADFAGPASDLPDDDRADELERLVADQEADAKADQITLGDEHREKVAEDSGLYEPVTWELSQTGDTESFAKAPKLTELMQRLIDTNDEFNHLQNFRFVVLWRAKGGTSSGEPKFASVKMLGGFERYQAGAHFLISFAADHCREHKLIPAHYEAVMYHELCHCTYTTDSEGNDKPRLQKGIEVFPSELKRHGLWRVGLQKVSDAMAQKALWENTNQMTDGRI